jgi:hypothetical protein
VNRIIHEAQNVIMNHNKCEIHTIIASYEIYEILTGDTNRLNNEIQMKNVNLA